MQSGYNSFKHDNKNTLQVVGNSLEDQMIESCNQNEGTQVDTGKKVDRDAAKIYCI